MAKSKKNKRSKVKGRTLAQQADKFDLYQKAVQSPDCEIAFFKRAYKDAYGKPPAVLREDFCATAAVCCEWVKKKERQAIGVDIDPKPLSWCEKHNFGQLKDEQRQRVHLLQADARRVSPQKADVIFVGNFSICYLKTRAELLEYFKAARANLGDQGTLIIDLMGGSQVLVEGETDTHRKKGFTYIWEQRRFDPITHHCTFFIHFRFPDGSKLKRAFRYDWRLWGIPEIREVMEEAGFSQTVVYWEGTERDTGEGNGVYSRRANAPSDATWLAYIVAVK